ncbi:hypothetical protein, partial [Tritonibacter sp. SIMBA_163]|uniref:hypothetical protein n=1 Tax=Tritonibacter sp. SIMBA_163 TaxID=3080868 RepID=UPI00397FB3AB
GELDADELTHHWPRTDTIPFESEHKFMATLHHSHAGEGVLYAKGATERILAMCDRQQVGERIEPIDADFWQRREEDLASKG